MKPPRNEREHPITAPPSAGADDDPLYDQAVQLVVTNNRASVSLVQRHLRIGYNRASSLLERMESEGLVSPMSVTGNRSILPKIRESSYAYSLAREVSLGGGRITPERVAFERELAFEAQPSSDEVRSMVEDTWRLFLGLAARGLRESGEGVITRFDAKVQTMASRMSPGCAEAFLASVKAERAKILEEYTASPAQLKKRLGVDAEPPQLSFADRSSFADQPLLQAPRSHRSNRQGMGEMATKTVIRAFIWNAVRSLFR